MSGIYWLTSYPKSGNTWLRAFLTNYRLDSGKPAGINNLDGGWQASLRTTFDELLGIESIDLNSNQIDHYRPLVYEQMARECASPLFLKLHDAFVFNASGRPVFSKQATAGVIYLIRNPLDVAVSFAHHRDEPIDDVIRFMGSADALLSRTDKSDGQLPQKLLSWSGHVASWVDEPGLNIHIVRYEDMVRQPVTAFSGIARFAGLAVDAGRVIKAIEFSRFERLQMQEAACGFAEKQPTAASFFRLGRVGSWREMLTPQQVCRLVADHRAVMRRFGYLSASNTILC